MANLFFAGCLAADALRIPAQEERDEALACVGWFIDRHLRSGDLQRDRAHGERLKALTA